MALAIGDADREAIPIPLYDNAGDPDEMPRGIRALSSPGRMKRPVLMLLACLSAVCGALSAQTAPTSTTVPAGVLYPTQNSAHVNGVRMQVDSDGAIWFLESSADIIGRFKD